MSFTNCTSRSLPNFMYMKTVRFNLEVRKKEGQVITANVPVRLSFHFNSKRLEYYTGIRVSTSSNFNKDYWKNGKAVIKKSEPDADRKNQRLKEMRVKAEFVHDSTIALGQQATPLQIKIELDKQFKGKNSNEKPVLVKDAFTEFLQYVKANHKESTLKKHNTTVKHLATVFGKEWDQLKFNDIDTGFAERFKVGLVKRGYSQEESKKQYLLNTVVKYLNSLREFLNWCKGGERKYFNGTVEFKDSEEEINVIYLNAEEIERLEKAKMPNKKLEEVKHVFLFMIYGGMRYSDVFKLKKSEVLENELRFYITKGRHTKWHCVPLVSKSKGIIEKYKGLPGDKALPVLSNQRMNDHLKEVMQIAGFNEILTIREVRGDGTMIDKEYQKWELVSCHTGRKSFVSFAIEEGIDEQTIKGITGHSKNSRAFHRYYEISEKKKKAAMSKLFENKNPLRKVS